MIVLGTFTVGCVLWIVLWALGMKGFDAFLIPVVLTFAAAGVQLAQPHVERLLKGGPSAPGQ